MAAKFICHGKPPAATGFGRFKRRSAKGAGRIGVLRGAGDGGAGGNAAVVHLTEPDSGRRVVFCAMSDKSYVAQ